VSTPDPPGGRSWLDPRIEVRGSDIEGHGLFALEPIEEGEIVIRLGGRLVDGTAMREAARTEPRYAAMQIDEDRHLLMDWDDPGSRGNHSCDPTLWLAGHYDLAARRRIDPGEELTTDYATMTADDGGDAWSMPCECSAETCRGEVAADDWRNPDLRERYRGHFAPFLQRRIEAEAT
jgi:uncharacterized protein